MKSWKTGLAGILAIVPIILHAVFPNVITSEVATTITSLFVGLGLIAAKDSNVTGGTKKFSSDEDINSDRPPTPPGKP